MIDYTAVDWDRQQQYHDSLDYDWPDGVEGHYAEEFLCLWERLCDSSADLGEAPPLTAEQVGIIYEYLDRHQE